MVKAGMCAYTFQHTAARRWLGQTRQRQIHPDLRFNTQPPEGGWKGIIPTFSNRYVSTHSRPKAAGWDGLKMAF